MLILPLFTDFIHKLDNFRDRAKPLTEILREAKLDFNCERRAKETRLFGTCTRRRSDGDGAGFGSVGGLGGSCKTVRDAISRGKWILSTVTSLQKQSNETEFGLNSRRNEEVHSSS